MRKFIVLDTEGFPSPLGEMGLSISREVLPPRLVLASFRPLSGKWGYRSNVSLLHTARAIGVSVPSRGNGVIDSIDNAIST